MKNLTNWVAGCFLIGCISNAVATPILSPDGSKVTDLDVGGTLYDVTFGDGIVGSVYASVVFDAAREIEARSVSNALGEFFNDEAILGTDIFGCGSDIACQIFLAVTATPTNLDGADSPLWFAPSGPPGSWGGQHPILFSTQDTAISTALTIATYALTPPSRVPAPATLALFGIGLAGLGWSRRKKA
jgi:hypothetical protein